MPSYVTPKINTQFIFYVGLVSQASRPQFQANPTLAAGDAKVSTDGGAFGNLGTLPVVTPASGHAVKVTLSAAEMNGDNIVVLFEDAAGDEWDDLIVSIQTSARQVDDLAYPTTSGRSIDVTTTGEVGLDLDNTSGTISAAQIATDAIGAAELATDAVNEIRDAILSDSTAFAGANLDAILSDIEADTQNIQTRLPAALVSGKMDSDAVAISGSTEAADNLEASAETIVVGAATATTLSTTQMSSNLTEATDDHYNGRIIIWTSGVLQDQATDITDYDGGTKTFTFTAVTEAPGNTDTFVIV